MATPPMWLQKIIDAATQNMPKDFVGQIEINCVNGRVGNVNIKQSYKENP